MLPQLLYSSSLLSFADQHQTNYSTTKLILDPPRKFNLNTILNKVFELNYAFWCNVMLWKPVLKYSNMPKNHHGRHLNIVEICVHRIGGEGDLHPLVRTGGWVGAVGLLQSFSPWNASGHMHQQVPRLLSNISVPPFIHSRVQSSGTVWKTTQKIIFYPQKLFTMYIYIIWVIIHYMNYFL